MRAHVSFLAVTLAAAALFAPPAHAGDSPIDTTFGAPGWQRSFLNGGGSTDERIVASARTPDAGYLLAGWRPGGAAGVSIFLAKFRPNGSYDPAFGGTAATGNAGSGRVLKDAYLSSVSDMTVDPQGRIVVVGSTPGALGQPDFGVVRFKPDGTDDTSFAGDGGTGIAFDADAAHSRVSDVPSSVATLPDGSIFVVGKIDERQNSTTTTEVVGVAKLKPDGSPDNTFGMGNGRFQYCKAACSDVGSVARMIYDAPRNRLIIGGDYNENVNNTDWFIITIDIAAESSTTSTYPVDLGRASGYQLAYMKSVAVQPDGKILASGWAIIETLASRPVVLRLALNNFSEDTAFGNIVGRGLYRGGFDNVVYNDLAVDSRGRIIVAGASGSPALGLVERLTPAGIADTSFNNGSSQAIYAAPVSGSPAHSTTFKRLFLDGGRPVLAGESPYSTSANTDYDLVITRLKSDLIFANDFE